MTTMQWISVKDRLPYEGKRLDSSLTYSSKVLTYHHSGEIKVSTFVNGECFGKPTHWMPLPEPPKDTV